EMLIRHEWTERELNQDTRHNPGQARQYLLYSRRTQLRIAYSPVQWTWRMCELMRSSAAEQSRWMRSVDLPAYCLTGKVA
ncbi:toxin VasX, partial [Pseudomonas sp. SDO55104_S430]